MMEIQTFAIGIIFLTIFYIIKRPRVGTNEPPLVPYTIPILGHTFDYLFNSKKFFKKCKEQYGECFSIYTFGSVTTIVSGKFINEVLKSHEDFNFTLATREFLPFHKLFPDLNDETINFHAKTAREQVSGKLDSNIPIAQKYLLKGIDKWIGDCDDIKIFHNIWFLINNIVALSIASIFVGEEAASHEDLVKTFGEIAFDLSPLALIPPVLSFIHKKLHVFAITLPLRFGWNPVSRHRKVMMNRLKPIVEKRLKEKNDLGINYKPYDDLLEYYMNQPNFDYAKPNNLLHHVDNLFMMIFAAVSTTSRSTANAVYDLAGRPECLNELYEEALTVSKECNGSLTVSDIKKMKKLDSFVKESLRHTDDIITLPHYMISDSYTFYNGYTIPNGRMIFIWGDDSLKSRENFGDDAGEFKPFRFLNTDSPATKVERSYIVFGGGRHACPGRFFAINEVKLFLHKLILKYNISTKSGKIEDKIFIGPLTSPSRSALVFENRK